MQAVQIHNGFFLVFSHGEEFVSTLSFFCEREGMHWGQFQGIGGLEDVEIGYYDLAERQYVFRSERGPFVIASLSGNICELGERPVVHAHAALAISDETMRTIGGHLREARAAVTLEVCLWQVTQPLLRGFDEDTGLDLIRL